MYRKLLVILALILAFADAKAQDLRFPYIVEVKEDADMQLSDSAFYKIARSVVFPVNKFNIPEHSPFYGELMYHVIPSMNARGYRLESITIRGAASPEGPTGWNQFLGEHRMKSLFNLIDKYMEEPSCTDCLKKDVMPEDYNYLLYMMADKGDKDYDRVKSYVDRYQHTNVEILKQRLMNLEGGALWSRLLKEYFPELRAARVVLFFRKSPNAKPELPGIKQIKEDEVAFTLDKDVYYPQMNIVTPWLDESFFIGRRPRRELLSLKTNLAMYGAYVPKYGWCPLPNVSVEFYPKHGHFTLQGDFDCPWWIGNTTNHKYFELRNYTIEGRYYVRSSNKSYTNGLPNGKAAFKGFYVSAYTNAFLYQIGLNKDDGWIGEGLGAGLGLGYVVPLGKRNQHWRLEIGAQFGFFRTKYDPFVYGCPVEKIEDGLYYYDFMGDADDFKKRQYRFTWLGPTRAGITLSYDLLYRKNGKKGVSFRHEEKGGTK